MVLLSKTHKLATIVHETQDRAKSQGNKNCRGVLANQQSSQKRITLTKIGLYLLFKYSYQHFVCGSPSFQSHLNNMTLCFPIK